MKSKSYKTCPGCGEKLSLRRIADDPNIVPIGMTATGDQLNSAYFYFQHNVPGCNSSFLVKVSDFHDFVGHKNEDSSFALQDCCGRQCVSLHVLKECRFPCGFEPYRKFLFKMIKNKQEPVSDKKKFSL